MTDFVVDYEENRRAEALGLEVLPTTLREGFGAILEETLTRNPTATLLREGEYGKYYDKTIYGELGTRIDIPAVPSTILSPQDANEKYGIEGRLTFDEDTPEPVAKELHRLKTEEIFRQETIRRSTAGIGANLTAGILGSVVDPLNIAVSFIPVVGEARFATIAGRVGTTAARGIKGAVEGTFGAAAVEPIVYSGAQFEQADYTAYDSLMNLTFGSVMGGGLHIGAGYIGDRWAGRAQASPVAQRFDDLPSEEQAAIIGTAAKQIEEGRPVDVAPLMDVATTHTERRANLEERRRVSELTPEEARRELLTSEKAGLSNERAYQEAPRKAHQLFFDLDNFKATNTRLSYRGADQLLNIVGQIMREEQKAHGVLAYHFHGDEFVAEFNDLAKLKEYGERVRNRLNEVTAIVTHEDGRVITEKGIKTSYGTGKTLADAEAALKQDKETRAAAGLRSERGGEHDRLAEQTTPEQQSENILAAEGLTSLFTERPRTAGLGVRKAPDAKAVKSWIDSQTQAYVDPEISASMQVAERRAKIEAGAPKDVAKLITDVEQELNDVEALLTEEDFAEFGTGEGIPSTKEIAALEQEEATFSRIYERAAGCLTGKS